MIKLKDWHIEDPLGELMKLAGADRLGDYWRVSGVPGLVTTGANSGRAWLAVPAPLHAEQRLGLMEAGFATSDEFTDIPSFPRRGLVTGLRVFIDPVTTSAHNLVAHATQLALRAQLLRGIVEAKNTASRMAAVLGQSLPEALTPAWETLTEVRWAEGDGYLATRSGSITTAWDRLVEQIRQGSPDGIRVRCEGSMVTVAAAAKGASFLIEEDESRQQRALIELASECFVMSLGDVVAARLRRSGDIGNARRLFHVEHTQAHGSRVWVFDPWSFDMVQHPPDDSPLGHARQRAEHRRPIPPTLRGPRTPPSRRPRNPPS